MARVELVTSPRVSADGRFLGWFMWVLLLAFAGLVAEAVAQRNYHFALAALLPAVLLAAIALGRPKSCCVEFGPTGLVRDEPPVELPYAEICGLTVGSIPYLVEAVPRNGIVRVMTPTSIVELGGRLDMSRRELASAILARLPRGGRMPEQPSLESFARSEREQFGDERVWTYGAAERYRQRSGVRYLGLGLVLLVVVWGIAAVKEPPWAIFSFLAFLAAMLMLARVQRGNAHKTIVGKKWRQAGLVITPTALAMIQGDLQGKLRWGEIKSVKYTRQRLAIEVAGATIHIADIYDRPIQQIVEMVRLYFEGNATGRPSPPPQ